jgi:hypothetical protein
MAVGSRYPGTPQQKCLGKASKEVGGQVRMRSYRPPLVRLLQGGDLLRVGAYMRLAPGDDGPQTGRHGALRGPGSQASFGRCDRRQTLWRAVGRLNFAFFTRVSDDVAAACIGRWGPTILKSCVTATLFVKGLSTFRGRVRRNRPSSTGHAGLQSPRARTADCVFNIFCFFYPWYLMVRCGNLYASLMLFPSLYFFLRPPDGGGRRRLYLRHGGKSITPFLSRLAR